jgi:hypothetical protein
MTYFNTKTRTLYERWGTDLLFEEFKPPVFNTNSFVFWIGSIWNNAANEGNIEEINELKRVLADNKLKFLHLRFIPDFLNRFFIRRSRVAPAIAGRWQVESNYPPCRMFKNISYGQLGITNVTKFKDLLGDSFVGGNSVREIIEKALSLSKTDYTKMVVAQQMAIKNYTYKNAIENIIKALSTKI